MNYYLINQIKMNIMMTINLVMKEAIQKQNQE